jgi:hypothetical protein
MEYLRPATQEEVAKIAPTSDLGFTEHYVWTLPDAKHGDSYFVFKHVWEMDPVHFAPGVPKNARSMILWMLENSLRMQGIPSFYFNIENKNKEFMDSMVHHGAERVSPTDGACPNCGASDVRFKKVTAPKFPEAVPAQPPADQK